MEPDGFSKQAEYSFQEMKIVSSFPMLVLKPSFRRAFRRSFPALLMSLVCGAAAWLPAQTSGSAAVAPGHAKAVVQFDPTKPETQPDLTVDRDPVLSPDPEDNGPQGVIPTAVATGPAGKIEKVKNGIYTLNEDVNEIILSCTVRDEKGDVVRDLNKSNFEVFERGVPQTINAFEFKDLPISLGILIDNSGSMRDKREAINAAALDLIRASNPKDEAFVVNFSDKAYLDQGFTSDIHALEHGLSRFDAKNLTAMYDAVAASADELHHQAKQRKQVLLIVTDGADNASRLTLEQVSRRVQRLGGPVVYSIGLLWGADKKEAEQARDDLQTLSDQTGGIAYFPNSLDDVDWIARQVARDIREQYTIGYHSSRPADEASYRQVRVEAHSPEYKNLTVRTSRGYYPATHSQNDVARATQTAPTQTAAAPTAAK